MSSIPDRLLSGGARIKFLPDGRVSICISPSIASADPDLALLPEICSPPIDVRELALEAGVIAEGAFRRLGKWIGKRLG